MQTLVTETISSNKSWDEIKDLLRLKICVNKNLIEKHNGKTI